MMGDFSTYSHTCECSKDPRKEESRSFVWVCPRSAQVVTIPTSMHIFNGCQHLCLKAQKHTKYKWTIVTNVKGECGGELSSVRGSDFWWCWLQKGINCYGERFWSRWTTASRQRECRLSSWQEACGSRLNSYYKWKTSKQPTELSRSSCIFKNKEEREE